MSVAPNTDGQSPRRNRQLVRTIAILQQLRAGGGYRLERLAREHGVTERTIRRDIEALEAAGVAICRSEAGDEHRGLFWIVGRRGR